MATLTNKTIASTYTSLLKLEGDTGSTVAGASGAGVQVKTGDNDATPLYLNTDRLGIGGSPSTDVEFFNTTSDTASEIAITTQSASGSASALILRSNRNNTVGSHTVVTNGQFLGQILFQGSDGTDYEDAARIFATVDASPAGDATDMPAALNFATTVDGSDSMTTRMVIKNDGSIGIGTESPTASKLSLSHTNNTDYDSYKSNLGATASTHHAVDIINSSNEDNSNKRYALLNFSSGFGNSATGQSIIGNVTTGSKQGNFIIGTRGGDSDPTVTEKFRVDYNGKIRITASTAEVLSLRSGDANGSHIIFEENTTARGYVGIAGGVVTSGGDNFVVRSEADLLLASGGNNTRITIDSSGNTTFSGTATVNGALIDLRASADTDSEIIFREGSTAKAMIFNDASANSLSLSDGGGTLSPVVNIYSGVVGIGTTDSAGSAGAENLIVGSGSGSEGMTIYSGTGDFGSIHFSDSSSSDAGQYRGIIRYGHGGSGDQMEVFTNSTKRMIIDSEGTVDQQGNYIVNEQGRQNHVANTMSSPYYRFDGTDDIIITGTYAYHEDVTVTAWVRSENPSSARQEIISLGNNYSANDTDWILYLDTDGTYNADVIRESGYHGYVDSAVNVCDGKWHHLALTVAGGTSTNGVAIVYVDGVAKATNSSIRNFTAENGEFHIGARVDGGGHQLNGEIAGITVWNKTATATEIKELYSGASVPFKYKGASQTSLVTGNDSTMAGSGNWSSTALGSLTTNYSADSRDTLRIITDDGSANDRATLAVTAVKGARYRIQYDYKAVQGNKGRVIWAGYDSGNQQLTSSSFATVTSEFTATVSGSTEITIYPSRADGPTGGSANDELLIDNLTLVRIGAVAEYDGSGIDSDRWLDKSGNDLHGSVTGASVENAPSGDDGLIYEEGDYDVTFTCGTSGTITLQSGFNRASYVRIGSFVSVTGLVIVDSVSSPTGYISVNLPFTPANLTDRAGDSAIALEISGVENAHVADFQGAVNEGTAVFYIQLGDGTTRQTDSAQEMKASTQIHFSVQFRA